MITLSEPQNGRTVPVTGGETTRFLDGLYKKYGLGDETVNPFARTLYLLEHTEDSTHPEEILFSWQGEKGPYELVIGKSGDMSHPFIHLTTEDTRVTVSNFEIGATYFWSVNGCPANMFHTADVFPRWLNVEGLTNVRDIGGRRTADGRRVKQGLIYRGSEMDTHYTVTEAGIRCMLDQLRIQTDLDLREEAVGIRNSSPLGDSVRYLLIPFNEYVKTVSKENPGADTVKKLFDVFADKSNYPLYVHCWGGSDRTGTLIMLLQSVLGVTEEDMLTDYELTCLGARDDRRRDDEKRIAPMLRYLNTLEGDTLAQRAVSFLKSCHITDETVRAIRDILLV